MLAELELYKENDWEVRLVDTYVTGGIIKKLRENLKMTQHELGERIDISDKAISKWETGKSLPDISLLEPLAKALNVSVSELVSGKAVTNNNKTANMMRGKFYVCPVCGNVVHSLGEVAISCCGVMLPPLEAEDADEEHDFNIEQVEDEYYITISHDMTKKHYISFIAFVSYDSIQLHKLYPEGNAECRIKRKGRGIFYMYCNHHGLFKKKI